MFLHKMHNYIVVHPVYSCLLITLPCVCQIAANHGLDFVKGMGIVYIWHSDMVGKVTHTKMELIIYGIDNNFKVEFCIANKGMNFSHFPLQIIQISTN